ncbi:Os08g0135651 [Oryza sativa Japonica Group]|nr:Os08g0135651 [Oryza sativa Japonica Group]
MMRLRRGHTTQLLLLILAPVRLLQEITIEEAATTLAPPPPQTISSMIGSLRGRGRRVRPRAPPPPPVPLAGSTRSRVHVITYRSPAASAAAAALPWIDWARTASMKAAPGCCPSPPIRAAWVGRWRCSWSSLMVGGGEARHGRVRQGGKSRGRRVRLMVGGGGEARHGRVRRGGKSHCRRRRGLAWSGEARWEVTRAAGEAGGVAGVRSFFRSFWRAVSFFGARRGVNPVLIVTAGLIRR